MSSNVDDEYDSMIENDDNDKNEYYDSEVWKRITQLENVIKTKDKEMQRMKNEHARQIEQLKIQYLTPMMARIKRLESQMNPSQNYK